MLYRDVSTGVTGATEVAPKFSDTLALWGGGAHPVPDRRILFKKSLMVLKDPYGSPEVPYTPESQNPLFF